MVTKQNGRKSFQSGNEFVQLRSSNDQLRSENERLRCECTVLKSKLDAMKMSQSSQPIQPIPLAQVSSKIDEVRGSKEYSNLGMAFGGAGNELKAILMALCCMYGGTKWQQYCDVTDEIDRRRSRAQSGDINLAYLNALEMHGLIKPTNIDLLVDCLSYHLKDKGSYSGFYRQSDAIIKYDDYLRRNSLHESM